MSLRNPASTLLLLLTLPITSLHAVLVTYSTEAAFDAAAPGLVRQDFSAGTGNFSSMPNPLNTTTATAATGPILPGVEIATDSNSPFALLVLGAGTFPGGGPPNRSVYANLAPDTLNISFASGQTAVGLGLVSLNTFNPVVISVYDTSSVLIATFEGSAQLAVSTFWGVTSTVPIGRINLNASRIEGVPVWEGIDAIKFSAAAVPDPASSILCLVLGLGLCGMTRRLFLADTKKFTV